MAQKMTNNFLIKEIINLNLKLDNPLDDYIFKNIKTVAKYMDSINEIAFISVIYGFGNKELWTSTNIGIKNNLDNYNDIMFNDKNYVIDSATKQCFERDNKIIHYSEYFIVEDILGRHSKRLSENQLLIPNSALLVENFRLKVGTFKYLNLASKANQEFNTEKLIDEMEANLNTFEYSCRFIFNKNTLFCDILEFLNVLQKKDLAVIIEKEILNKNVEINNKTKVVLKI